MLNSNGRYYYEDNSMFFEFNTINSRDYNLFIVSDSSSTIVNDSGAKTNYSSPLYGDTAYVLGTTKNQKTFTWNCAAEGLTPSLYKEMMQWLNEGAKGFLVRDNNPSWGYNVVLEKVGNAQVWEQSRNNLIVEFQLTFKTYGDWCAKARFDAATRAVVDPADEELLSGDEWIQSGDWYYCKDSALNEYKIPEIWFDPITNKYRIIDIGNEHSYFVLDMDLGSANFENTYSYCVKASNKDYDNAELVNYKYGIADRTIDKLLLKYYSNYGFVVCNNKLLEQAADIAGGINNGAFYWDTKTPRLKKDGGIFTSRYQCCIALDNDNNPTITWCELNNGEYNTYSQGYLCNYLELEVIHNIPQYTQLITVVKHNNL